MEMRFDRIYPHTHFIPMDHEGTRLLKILVLHDWEEQILSAAFPSEWRVAGPKIMEHDARRGDTLIFSHLDSDIARLVRLRQGMEHYSGTIEVLCFPWQTEFLHGYLGRQVHLREITMDTLEEALNGELE